MINHGKPAGQPALRTLRTLRTHRKLLFFFVGKLEGHERTCRRSISNHIGTSRIPVKKSIVLNGQNDVLGYPGVRIRGK